MGKINGDFTSGTIKCIIQVFQVHFYFGDFSVLTY